MFVENLGLLIVKNHLPLQFMENVWLKRLVLQLCPHVQFHSQKLISSIVLLELVKKTKETYVLPLLNDCSFDLWISKSAHDVFVLVINFWDVIGNQIMLLLVCLKLLKLQDKCWLEILLNF